ncbi:MAG TPA: hypothetical protein VEH84_16530 [Alphaproteobacteria bacterium]|nr:hypothetical protein [Alphaproteobacteria bacterium]
MSVIRRLCPLAALLTLFLAQIGLCVTDATPELLRQDKTLADLRMPRLPRTLLNGDAVAAFGTVMVEAA